MAVPEPNNIIKLMKEPSYRPMRSRELAKRLGVSKEERALFKKVLRKLVKDNKVRRLRGGQYALNGPAAGARAVEVEKGGKGGDAPPEVPAPARGKRVLGNYVRTGKTGMVIPRDIKLPPLIISPKEIKGLRSGSLVVCEVAGPKRRDGRVAGVVVEVLGKAGPLEVEKKALYVQYDLPEGFPREVVAEAERIEDSIAEQELRGRVDLRRKTIFTIDGEDAKDFDDAVGIERHGRGWKLYVSIADVSHYVRVGGAIDNEALQRATSIYLPGRVVPMLPETLSNWVCSLVPRRDRLTKTVEMVFSPTGEMKGFKVYKSVIRSKARLTYTEVTEFLEEGKRSDNISQRVGRALVMMKELYTELKKRRIENGELDFDFPEPELIYDELGRTVDVVKSARNIAHGIIEEAMIAANSAVARLTYSKKRASIYRVHEPPDTGALKELSESLKKVGMRLAVNGPVDPHELQRLIYEARGTRHQLLVNTLILQSLNRAVYTTDTLGHFGLGLDHYTHFTSPIRRYPDLVVHRVVDAILKGRRLPYDIETLRWISSYCSDKERLAERIEREAIELERAEVMKSHVGEVFDAFVTSVMPFGLFVELERYFVEGLVPRRLIHAARGRRFDVGESVRVRLLDADLSKRRLTFELVT